MNKAPKNLRYSEFRQAWDQGRVITNDAERPLKVITTDTAYDATITGWVSPKLVESKDSEAVSRDFRVEVNLELQGDQIRDMLGDDFQVQQVNAETETPIDGDLEMLSLAEFRKFKALGQIQADDGQSLDGIPLRILTAAAAATINPKNIAYTDRTRE